MTIRQARELARTYGPEGCVWYETDKQAGVRWKCIGTRIYGPAIGRGRSWEAAFADADARRAARSTPTQEDPTSG